MLNTKKKKKFVRLHLMGERSVRSIDQDHGPGWPGKKEGPYFQNNHCKKNWKHGLSRRTPTQQIQSPEFKPQY
jgi:hypothetical protein